MTIHSELYMLFDTYPAHIVAFVQWLVQSYRLPDDLHMLDVGCGPGRLLQPCAALGWRVTGLEPNADYFSHAQHLAGNSDAITVRQGGFADIDVLQAYDLLTAANGPFAYLLTITDRRDALLAMFRALKPGGVLFLDFANFLWTMRYYRPPQESVIRTEQGDSIRRVIRHDIDWHDSTFTHTDTFYRNDQRLSTQVHCMAIITPQELLHLVTEAGFQQIRTYNSYIARQHQPIRNERIMLSAQKPL